MSFSICLIKSTSTRLRNYGIKLSFYRHRCDWANIHCMRMEFAYKDNVMQLRINLSFSSSTKFQPNHSVCNLMWEDSGTWCQNNAIPNFIFRVPANAFLHIIGDVSLFEQKPNVHLPNINGNTNHFSLAQRSCVKKKLFVFPFALDIPILFEQSDVPHLLALS